MASGVERVFALAAAAVLVLSGATALGAGAPNAASTAARSFDAGVPGEYEFTPPNATGTATVDGESFDSAQAAVDAANPGETVWLSGQFREPVTVDTPNLTLTSASASLAVIDGGGEEDALTIDADGVTVRRVWIRNSGFDAAENDAAVWVNGSSVSVVNSRVSAMTFGIWVDGVDDAVIRNNTVVGRESVRPLSYRGNGIQLWKTEDTLVADNRITDVRDGIYYSWASGVVGRNNTMWDLRYGVHYMYSDDCRLVGNVAFGNDVGYALMTSENLDIADNVAVNNTGSSGHGLLLKRIDGTTVRNNSLVANGNGLYVYNSVRNELTGNLVMDNDVGVHLTAGSSHEVVRQNSFIANSESVYAVINEQVAWNGSTRGNYWSSGRTVDVNHDGVSEVRHRPAGLAERLVWDHPQAAAFVRSPAFNAIRLAESTVPVIESPGVVDHRPLADPSHNWRNYDERNTST